MGRRFIMLKVIVCWCEGQVDQELRELHEDQFKINRSRRYATKDKLKVQVITQLKMKYSLEGMNPDVVEFKCAPDDYELQLAIERTRAKKGSVFIRGRLNYDHHKQEQPIKATFKA